LLAGLLAWMPLSLNSAAQGLASEAREVVLTQAAQIRALSRDEAGRGYGVKLDAIVTFSDGDSGLLFVQDDTSGVYVAPQEPVTLTAGTRVLVTGIVQPGSHLPYVAGAVLFDRGLAAFPKAKPVSFERLASGEEDSNWIETEGVVRSVQVGGNQLRLVLAASGQRILARISEPAGLVDRITELVDAEARIQGVAGARSGGRSDDILMVVHLPYPQFLEVRARGIPALQTPLRTTDWLRQQFPTNQLVHRIRIRGTVENELGAPVRLRDEFGAVELATASLALTSITNASVEVVGFPAGNPATPRLEHPQVLILRQRPASDTTAAEPSRADQTQEFLPLLTEIDQVRRLSVEEAARGYPVRLRGVITFLHVFPDGTSRLFAQDATAGIYVSADRVDPAAWRAGSVMDIEGISDPGQFAPIISQARLTLLGEGPLPAARLSTIEELLTGRKDSQRIRVHGIIARVEREASVLNLRLLAGGTLVDVLVPAGAKSSELEGLVDAAVQVDGVCGTSFNDKRQLIGVSISVARAEDIRVVKAPPEDSFGMPLRSIRSLFQFNLNDESRHRVRVRGVITLNVPGLGIFLQDDQDGLFVSTERIESLEPGDLVEVIGFPLPGRPGTSLIESHFRKLDSGSGPRAQPLTEGELSNGELNNRLVVLEGKLLEKRRGTNHYVLACQAEERIFEALGRGSFPQRDIQALDIGSRLRLTGVWAVLGDSLAQPPVAQLWLRSLNDIEILERPAWWTPRRAKALGSGLLVLILGTLGWVALLRREVRERTAQSQKALAFLKASIAQSPSGILIAEAPNGTIRWANPAALGGQVDTSEPLSEIEVSQQSVRWEAFKPDETPYPWEDLPLSRAVLRGELIRDEEHVIRNAQGQRRWVSANAAPIRDSNGAIIAGIVVFHDITERKRAEEDREKLQAQLLQAQKMESVGRLAGGVAHDFNNMLQTILGNVDLALAHPTLNKELRDDLIEIQKAAHHSADLTRQLLAFARKQTVVPKVLDLNTTVSGTLKMLQRLIGENIRLTWLPGPNLWPVKMDPSQLDQILANLTVNSRDAISGTGTITIETSNITLDDTLLARNPEGIPGDYVRLAVKDDGRGMDPQTQKHLFEPFFTTKGVGQGTGLGLATVYGIVRQNGGIIEVESEAGHGSAFRVYLPRCQETLPVAETDVVHSLRGHETVLLVEDEEQVLTLERRILERQGYTVLSARDPQDALEIIDSLAGPLHLLITDVVMPKMNGRELRDRVAALKPGVKCLFMSGYTADVIAKQGVLEAGVEFLQKPFSKETLSRRIREVLESGSEAPSHHS